MTPERYQLVGKLYHAALELDADKRAAFLEETCAGDEELRLEVESLIASHEEASDFIATPALAVAAEILGQRDSLVGQTLGHYRVLSLLGEGGMGEVYLAEDTRLGRRVALKLLSAAFTHDDDRMRRFVQEARAASALNHPNILTVHEIGRANNVDFIAAEFIEGETLRPSMAKRRLKLTQALDVAAQVAGALAAAHAAGVVHRDIKPENIMLRPDGYVKVLDFGLAKLAAQGLQLDGYVATVDKIETHPGVVMGTVQYMSPEQARGIAVDARTDVWSLGVVLYEMVASRPPFAGETHSDTIVSILEREPAPLELQAPEVSAELERIVTKALTKDKDERYQTAKDMAIDLRRLRRRLDIQAEIERSAQPAPTSSGRSETTAVSSGANQRSTGQTEVQAARASYTAERRRTSSVEYVVEEIKKHRRGAALLGGALVLLLGGVGFGLYKFLIQPKPAVSPFQTTSLTRVTTTGKAKVAAISPDGKYVVYTEEENRQNSLWVKQIATGSTVLIVPPADVGYWGLTFSNDSDYVYYVKNEKGSGSFNKLYQVPSLGGVSKKLMEHVDSAVAFSPNGQRFAFVRDNLKKGETQIVLANSDGTGEQTLATRRAPDRFESDLKTRIGWSPDGKIIACAARTSDASGQYFNVVGVSVEGGVEKPLTSQRWRNTTQVAWLSDGGGLVMNAMAEGSTQTPPQLWYLSYPGGEARRITNDLNRYSDVSLTANSGAILTVQTNRYSNIWIVPKADPSQARQITTGTMDGNSGISWTPNGRIVYTSEASGKAQIWLMDSDGQNKKQLTSDGENRFPAVSSDGRYVFFTSVIAGKYNVWRMDVDGNNPKQLTYGKINSLPFPSPKGQWVAYTSMDQGNATVWKAPVDGGQPVQLTDPTANLPVISPDGKLIACFYWDEQANPPRGTMIIPFDGGPPTKRFNFGPHIGGFVLHWTPDGRAILYIGLGLSNIWSQPLDGGNPVQLTDFQGEQVFNFDYSPDGKWLATARGRVTDDVVMITDFK